MKLLRALSIFGLGALFLLISPSLRGTVLSGLWQVTIALSKYSPYSYIGLALVLCAGAMKTLATPRPQ
jgi:hypothetical protein